ncbi:MAG: redoxin domain-containing protein [Planctomycetes bacterium]|nr:redoxin domain-containing protein [Planctomycetota bacterium]
MKKMLFAGLVLGLCTALPVLAQDRKNDEKPAPAKVEAYKLGSVVDENITLTDLDGNSLKFKDLRGKVVFIHFWSKNCPYEIAADPKTVALAEQYKDKDVVCLAINSNATEIGAERPKDGKTDENYNAIREHLKEKKMSFPVYADHGNKVADLFNAQHTPHCFVIDQKGVLRYMGGLDDDPKGDKGEATKQYVRDAVNALLEGKEPPMRESKPYGCGIKRVKVKA